VTLEAFDGAGVRIGAAALLLAAARGSPALLDATLDAAEADRPIIKAIVAPRTSVVQGERMLLQARVSGSPATLAWAAAPPGCGTFAQAAAATEWTAVAAGRCTLTLTAATADKRDRRSVTVVVRTRGRSYQNPLAAAPGGRVLVDQRGTPFLVKGESA